MWLTGIVYFLLCLAYPNSNPATDAWAYAADIRYGTDIFRPHHLLYGPVGYLLHHLLRLLGAPFGAVPTPYLSLHVYSALCTTASYFLLYGICLKRTSGDQAKSYYLAIGAGMCWGVIRFGTTIEVYAPAMAAALAGTYVFLCNGRQALLKSSLWLVLACLFHQSFIFWWLAMSAAWYSRGSSRGALLRSVYYLLPGIILFPLVYSVVLVFYEGRTLSLNTLWNYVLKDAVEGHITYPVNGKLVFFTLISFVRSYIQLHGFIAVLFKKAFFVSLGVLLTSLSLLFFIVRALVRYRTKWYIGIFRESTDKMVIVSAGLFYVFGAINLGNAEFMAPLPALTAIWLAGRPGLFAGIARNAALALGLWNLWFGVYAAHHLRYQANEVIVERLAATGRPIVLITEEKPTMENIYHYISGNDATGSLRFVYPPATAGIDSQAYNAALLHFRAAGYELYEDVSGRPKMLNKLSIQNNTVDRSRHSAGKTILMEPTDVGLHVVREF